MKNSAMLTSVNVDTAMYFARVITFDIAANGIGMPFFKANQIKNVADWPFFSHIFTEKTAR